MTPRTAVQGVHGLAVKTMFRFYPSSLNKDECWLGLADYGRVPEVGKSHLLSGDQDQRIDCVDEIPLRGFGSSLTYGCKKFLPDGSRLTYGCKTRQSTQQS